jgi:hypothetical protein
MYEPTPENLPEGWEVSLPKEDRSLPKDNREGEGGSPIEKREVEARPITVIIYALLDPRDRVVRYVGKTHGTLAVRLRQHINNPKNVHVAAWIRSLLAASVTPIIEEIERIENSNDLDWQDRERFWIAEYRSRGCDLTNLCSGGVGGNALAEETKKKIGAGNKGKVRSKETLEKLSKSHIGKKLAPEHVANMSKAVKGIPRGPYPKERVEKVAAAQRGKKKKPRTPEHQAKLNAAQTGRFVSDETRARISAAQTGKKRGPYCAERVAKAVAGMTTEARKKMSEASLKYWEGKRLNDSPQKPSPDSPSVQP